MATPSDVTSASSLRLRTDGAGAAGIGGRHVLLVHPDLHGPEYGMLRDFEQAIIAMTGARVVPFPEGVRKLARRLPLGTRNAAMRRWCRRVRMDVDADTVWVVCMGPENHLLDLVSIKAAAGARKILYLFDTLPHQADALRQVAATSDFDLLVTSFPDAVDWLEQITGRSWNVVLQGACSRRFEAPDLASRVIPFSSYGRRLEVFHDVLRDWSVERGIYYDFQTSASVRADVPCDDLYRQYAWHVGHSVFSICWPVEATNPARAGFMSPITCRWFEAAMAAAVIVGRAPALPQFRDVFPRELVTEIPDGVEMRAFLDELWSRRHELHERSMAWRSTFAEGWSWEARVSQMLKLREGFLEPRVGGKS